MWTLKILFVDLLLLFSVYGKIYNKCELAQELKHKHSIPDDLIAIYTCIAERQSNFNTEAVGDGYHFGMYQLSSEFWCSTYGAGKACNLECSDLLDDDISDDLACMDVILEEHQRLSGDGFNAWPSYRGCKAKQHTYVSECFDGSYTAKKYEKPIKKKILKSSGGSKVYDRCELARELRDIHNMPVEQIATWVCIVKHESNFNTSAIGRLNWDGSEDHGLFQISDIYWCSPPGKGWACGVTCAELEDEDITDDVECVKKIYEEHQRLSGDGFNAWTVYRGRCKGKSDQYIEGCFEDENDILPYKPRPGIIQTTKPTKPSRKPKPKKTVGKGKVYRKCELAQELRYQHGFSMEHVATWVCIAKHESDFNTSAIGRLNWDGSEDHGLFQISDLFWCSPPGKGWACDITCAELEDSDITDDVECIRKIYEEHQRLSGDGFNAWTVYPERCKGTAASYVSECFDDSENLIDVKKQRPAITAPPRPKTTPKSLVGRGKVYNRCELAQELRYKFKIPMESVATWVCIAQHESNFNTSAIGRLNWDGSEDHGLFQISDIYWCSPPGKGWACGLTCEELEDNDITDDVECILKIYEEHQGLSGDGFNAWTVYKPHCKGRSEKYIDGCFSDSDVRQTTVKSPQIFTSQATRTTWRSTSTKAALKTTRSTTRATTRITSTNLPKSTTKLTTKTTKASTSTLRTTKSDFFAEFFNRFKTQTVKSTTKLIKVSTTRSPTKTTQGLKTTLSTTRKSTTSTKPRTTKLLSTTSKITPTPKFKSTLKPTTSTKSIFDVFANRFSKLSVTATKSPKTSKLSSKTDDFESVISTTVPYNNEIVNRFNIPTTKIQTKTPNIQTTTGYQYKKSDDIQISNGKLVPVVSNSLSSSTFNLYQFYLDFFNSKKPISFKPINSNKGKSSNDKPHHNSIKSGSNLTPHSFDYLLQLTTPRKRF